MGKGSKPRPVDREAYEEGFDRIFPPKEKPKPMGGVSPNREKDDEQG